MKELDTVVLTRDLPNHGLVRGDVGAIVLCYGNNEAYEVEFVNADGDTIALLTLTKEDVRPMQGNEVLHVRDLAST